MTRDFWLKSSVAVLGGGAWGTMLAQLVASRVSEVRLWVRNTDRARSINATRMNADYLPELRLADPIKAMSELERVFDGGVQVVIFALPSQALRLEARRVSGLLRGDELVLHATKGLEIGTLKRMSVVLGEEIPTQRIGVISGPNLAEEIARGEPAATVVASCFDEVIDAGRILLETASFSVVAARDVVGVEWAGTLKNILAIAAGVLDGAGLGWNARAFLISAGLQEMVRFGAAMGAEKETFLGLAGVGDLLATCGSSLSRNYRVGYGLAQGRSLDSVLEGIGGTAEGVVTARAVSQYARARGIWMPLTDSVCEIMDGQGSIHELLPKVLKVQPKI